MLRGSEAVYVSTILEDTLYQLQILGKIMPYGDDESAEGRQIINAEIAEIVDTQRELEEKFERALARKIELKPTTKMKVLGIDKDLKEALSELRQNIHAFGVALKQSPVAHEQMQKTQADRQFLQKVLMRTYEEVCENGEFVALSDAINGEQGAKAELQSLILKEEETRQRRKVLTKQIAEVKRDMEADLKARAEMIAHLKDQLQEMKAKTSMENRYMKKSADLRVAMTQKKCELGENDMRGEIESLKRNIDEESRVNSEIESYLQSQIIKLEGMIELWAGKYDQDMEKKERELNLLKTAKAKDVERLQDLTRLYKEYEQVVVEDRIEKEKARRKAEQEALELKATVKIQAWWRGIMVRKGLGPYGKKKKKKGKKGKKGKGKKGGKKGGKKKK